MAEVGAAINKAGQARPPSSPIEVGAYAAQDLIVCRGPTAATLVNTPAAFSDYA